MSTQSSPRPKRLIYPITEAREILGGIGNTKFWEMVKDGRIRLTSIDGRRFVSDPELKRVAGV